MPRPMPAGDLRVARSSPHGQTHSRTRPHSQPLLWAMQLPPRARAPRPVECLLSRPAERCRRMCRAPGLELRRVPVHCAPAPCGCIQRVTHTQVRPSRTRAMFVCRVLVAR
eukprot:7373024-Prymnesium_polylepis.1